MTGVPGRTVCPLSFVLHWTHCGYPHSNVVCVPAHKEKLTTGELLSPAETTVYRECVAGLLYYTQDRADAQYEVSILGSMLGKPTQGSMIRYLKSTRLFVNKLELDTEVEKHVTRLDGFSDSDWAGSTDRKSQSSGALCVDGAHLYSFSS